MSHSGLNLCGKVHTNLKREISHSEKFPSQNPPVFSSESNLAFCTVQIEKLKAVPEAMCESTNQLRA